MYSSTFGLKTSNHEFIDSINNIDLIILHETWRHDNTPSNCPSNYNELSLPSLKYPHIKNGRHSGGIIIWYRQEHHNYILPVKKGKTHIWLKISRRLLENSKDVYLCAIYLPPSSSPYYSEGYLHEIQKEILYFQSLGSTLLCGDFNARTGREIDFINTDGNNHFDVSPLYQPFVTTHRHSYDSIVNKSGKEVLQMCKALGLYIVNGRTRGDSLGRFTYCSVLGNSVIDYAITDICPESISAFTVLPQRPISDHNQITLSEKSRDPYPETCPR